MQKHFIENCLSKLFFMCILPICNKYEDLGRIEDPN